LGSDHPTFRKVFASLFLPEGTPEPFNSFDALQRASTPPENAEKFFTTFYNLDVLEFASQVRTPTMVIHVTDDLVVPVAQACLLAATIPNARLVPLEGRNHISARRNRWARFLQEIDAFMAE
jgi:pimeloyl-ACP methyl ester carboxylesterase